MDTGLSAGVVTAMDEVDPFPEVVVVVVVPVIEVLDLVVELSFRAGSGGSTTR